MRKYLFIFLFVLIGFLLGQDSDSIDIENQSLICEEDEVDLGWGDCNSLGGYSFTPDGCMPSGCFSIEETYEINFSYINLGELPPSIGNLINIINIHISDCGLYGSLPSSLSNLQNLISIQIYDNDHNLPDSLGLDSQLSGIIPVEIGSLENLQYLRLDNNNLTGEIPSELTQLENLVYIILSGNQLSGEIPHSLMDLTNLTSLSLSRNQISGIIPENVIDLINLEVIDLSNNNLSGSIPFGMEQIPNLYYVNLSNNNLSGNINEQYCDMYFVDFSNNSFCSPYAQCLSNEDIGIQDTLNCIELVIMNKNINPYSFQLNQNYPNPFNPITSISYQVQLSGDVTLNIYDILGNKIKTLIDEPKAIGDYEIKWNGTNQIGDRLSSGQYFYQLKIGDFVSTKKMVLLK
mgnify:CR=1 FL=1|tara:strand:- start:647 stop:1861 length:1215 start_codon:yes stop_codon:yes gene_type:complete